MLLDIRPDHLQIVQAILQKHIPEYEIWAFGSRAKWKAKEYSDLDLCVITKEPLSFTILGLMAEDFSESDLPWKVDVVDWSTTNESFRKIIEKDKVVIQKGVKKRVARTLGTQKIVGQVSDSACAPEGITRQTVAESEANVELRYANPTYAADWQILSFGEVTINHDTKRKPVKGPDRKPGPYPYYGASGVVDYVDGYLFDGDYLLIAEDGENLRTRQTPIAFMASGKFWVNNHAHIVTGNKRANTRFLMYALLNAGVHSFLTGAVMPKLTQGNLNNIPIACPPREIQDAIVGVLGALDDRITLLRETNTTLEAIAQTLFKSWFVDFDPVRAKQQGREPEGMDSETAALFPDSFEESELGLVPKGWRVGTLGDIAQTTKHQLQVSELNADLNYVGLEHIPRKSLCLSNWGNAEGLESAKASFVKGDILFGKLRPYFHKVVIAPFDGVCSTDILVCQPTEELYSGVTAMHLFSVPLIDYADRLSNGAKMPRINWKDLAAYPICVPPAVPAAIFREMITPLITRMMANTHQAQTLATLRDTLLPRLISGQLRLPEASPVLV